MRCSLGHSGSLVRFGDFCISLLGNHVLACTSLWGCKVGNIFAKIYSFMTNGSDPLKIWVSFHLLTFAHSGWCLWCEGEGLSHCAPMITLYRKFGTPGWSNFWPPCHLGFLHTYEWIEYVWSKLCNNANSNSRAAVPCPFVCKYV